MTAGSGREQWRADARAVLERAGAPEDVDPDAALRTLVDDGPAIEALYAPDNAAAAVPLDVHAGDWDVRQRIDVSGDPVRANREVLAELAGGVTSVWLTGVSDSVIPAVLDGVLLDVAGVALDGDPAAAQALWASSDDTSTLRGSLGLDPVTVARRAGESVDTAVAVPWAARCVADAPRMRAVVIDAAALHVDGADPVGQVAWSLVSGAALLRALTDGGLTITDALAQLELRWALTDDQFTSTAMLRAARRVWSRVADLCGAEANVTHHAVTSPLMMTQRDPWTNLLRTTIAALAAATGGADAITVLSFDHALGRPEALARRVARNTHHVLASESSLTRVTDPAAGSYYVETLTDQLANAAWDRFTAAERAGGLSAALRDGTLRADLDASRRRTADGIASRRRPLVGVTRFATVDEQRLGRAEPVPPDAQARWAQPFERLRDRADASTPRPVVALVGDERRDAARLAVARDLFAAGGLDTVIGEPAGHALVCVCTEQPRHIAGARRTWHVGPDGLHDGVDVLALLSDAWVALDADGTAAQ